MTIDVHSSRFETFKRACTKPRDGRNCSQVKMAHHYASITVQVWGMIILVG